jgi:hypothetical protein
VVTLPKVVGEHSHPLYTVGGLTNRGKGNILPAYPTFTGIKWKCTQVAETPTSPVQYKQGEEGGFYLTNWLVHGCFMAENGCPGEFFAGKIRREKAKHTRSFRAPT